MGDRSLKPTVQVVWRGRASALLTGLFATLLSAPAAQIWPPTWNASAVLEHAEAIVIVDGPLPSLFSSSGEIFSTGAPAFLRRFEVAEVLDGEVKKGESIVVAQPSGHMHGFANIRKGESLLFLKLLSKEDVQTLREGSPDWADDLPEQVWTFAWDRAKAVGDRPGSGGYQWMSWVQFSSVRYDLDTMKEIEGDIERRPNSILVAQLDQEADVQQEKEAILAYIKDLIALRQAALDGAASLDDDVPLDVFQRDVIQGATAERARGAEEASGE